MFMVGMYHDNGRIMEKNPVPAGFKKKSGRNRIFSNSDNNYLFKM